RDDDVSSSQVDHYRRAPQRFADQVKVGHAASYHLKTRMPYRQIDFRARVEVVQYNHRSAVTQQMLYDVRPDEAGATGYKYSFDRQIHRKDHNRFLIVQGAEFQNHHIMPQAGGLR